MKKVTYIISDIDKALAFEWIAGRMDRSKIRLSFILVLERPAALEGFLKEHGLPVHTCFYKNKMELAAVFLRLYVLLKKLKPDVVHCHLFKASLLGLASAQLAGVKRRIYTRHHADFHHRYFPRGVKWDKRINRMATRIIAPSGPVKELLVQMEGVPSCKVSVIPHGFDLDYFGQAAPETVAALRRKYDTTGFYPAVGVISRFMEWKGIQYIIPAFRKLLAGYPDALILFFNARGGYESEIRRMLEAIPARNYRLIPFENELSAVYRLFDVYVQASIGAGIEAFGQTYVEALAAGVPSVFTLSGIAGDFIVDGENAVVAPFKDSDAIYRSMLKILEDDRLRERLRSSGPESVKEKFTVQAMINQLTSLYEAE